MRGSAGRAELRKSPTPTRGVRTVMKKLTALLLFCRGGLCRLASPSGLPGGGRYRAG